MVDELVSSDVTNSIYNNKSKNEIIVSRDTIIYQQLDLSGRELVTQIATIISDLPKNNQREVLQKLNRAFGIPTNVDTLLALCSLRAGTIATMIQQFGLDKMSVCRGLSELKTMGVAVTAGQVQQPNIRGPKPTVWALYNYAPEDIASAVQKHMKAMSPMFTESARVGQLVLDEYFTRYTWKSEEKMSQVAQFVNSHNPGFPKGEFLDHVANYCLLQGKRLTR
jgi:hypothetical protein